MDESADEVRIDRDPTPAEEQAFLENPIKHQQLLNFKSSHQDIRERRRYSEHAYGITQAWVGFLIVITIAQMVLKPIGIGLSQTEFVTVFTTTTASIFGFWLLVGRYLFPSKPPISADVSGPSAGG